ncbi:MAG: phage major tail tube protein [Allosphingosinicella sp.]|uniref:phage major tail tube protein n=1 Tax=Allosphingosinicella sp. TaxID=2823234 RepID=UPI0039334CCD
MGLPRILKHQMLFHNGIAYVGDVPSVTLPKLTRKLEGWRGGGMDGQVKIDLGMGDDLDLEFTSGGPLRQALREYGGSLTGTMLRFAGSYQRDDDGSIDAIEVMVRGRFEEIDMGEAKPGEAGEFKYKVACAFYELRWNGVEEIHIDVPGMVCRVGRVDRLVEHRQAIGRF